MEREFIIAFADIIREQIAQKNEVRVKDLGTFRQKHIQQFQQQYANGQVVMMPPKDEIEFIPE